MKFSTREDIEAPIEYVFAQISDFEVFERQALRRGADIRRLDNGAVVQGSAWDVAFKYRGKDRRLRATLDIFDRPNQMQVGFVSPNVEGTSVIELVPLTPHRTRVVVAIDIGAKSLSARLLLQSLKLAKANLTNRFKKRVADFSQDIEDRFKTGA